MSNTVFAPWSDGMSRPVTWKQVPRKAAVAGRDRVRPVTIKLEDEVERVVGERLDQVTLRDQVLQALDKTESDWRSLPSLARQLGTPVTRLEQVIESMPEVRNPIGATSAEIHHYRLVSRGLTLRERIRYVNLVLSRRAR